MTTLNKLRSGELLGSRRLNLSCELTTFPEEIYTLADTLEILDLSGNALSELPDDLPRLHKLRVLFCSNNRFTRLPAVLGKCKHLSMVGFKSNRIAHVPAEALPLTLRWLILTDNQISELPATIGRCNQLQKLMLAGNRLHTLPTEMAACSQLELLRISANRFTELPPWLITLPRLSWLAYGGNPLTADDEATALAIKPMTHIPWDTLALGHALGEGASGLIYQAQWQAPQPRAVAVKLFKAALTSDGLPLSEMASCIGAGEHPHLISAYGKIEHHPAHKLGLVMPLVSTQYKSLAHPPSLDSCTRDIYAAECSFNLETTIGIARGIASGVRHLHEVGILHGDLYAHNILHDDAGNALLGDFGAASFLPLNQQHQAHALQRIETRAFGCLLGELIEHTQIRSHLQSDTLNSLAEFQLRCTQPRIEHRPLFTEIERFLHRQ